MALGGRVTRHALTSVATSSRAEEVARCSYFCEKVARVMWNGHGQWNPPPPRFDKRSYSGVVTPTQTSPPVLLLLISSALFPSCH